MDGYALRAMDLQAGRRDFTVAANSFPGHAPSAPIGPGEAAKVTTGAALPVGATQVVPWENITVRDHAILVRDIPARRHVRKHGSDFHAGTELLPIGRVIDSCALAVAAAADRAALTVWRRPRVGVIATGDELVAPGRASATPLHQPDSLSIAMELFVRQWGGRPLAAVLLPDDLLAIERAATDTLAACDVLLMVGGASMGERDFAKAALRRVGLRLRFSNVAIKPGKPVWYGKVRDRHVLGLPGNPTAALTTARLFLAPLLAGLSGRTAGIQWSIAPLATAISANDGREAFVCATWNCDGVRPIERQSASSQMILGLADALVRRATRAPAAEVGQNVRIVRF